MKDFDFHPNYESLNLDKFKIPSEGYESPITVFVNEACNQILEQRENAIMSTFRTEYGITCDKKELIKALNYDRGQYDKGFQAGYEKAKQDIRKLLDNEICNCRNACKDCTFCKKTVEGSICELLRFAITDSESMQKGDTE